MFCFPVGYDNQNTKYDKVGNFIRAGVDSLSFFFFVEFFMNLLNFFFFTKLIFRIRPFERFDTF